MDLSKPVSAKEIRQTAQAMSQAIEQEAQQAGISAENRAAELAPGLATGSNAPGGYNYGRFIAPVVDPLTAQFTLAAQQNVLRDALRDAQFAADKEYEDAQYAYRQRQRDYQAEQARRNRERRQAAERQAAADRLAALRSQTPVATQTPAPAVVARPTRNIQTGVATSSPSALRVTNSGGVQGYGGVPNNVSLLGSSPSPAIPINTMLRDALRISLGGR